jgi:branched-chain amino acid aminotransferase
VKLKGLWRSKLRCDDDESLQFSFKMIDWSNLGFDIHQTKSYVKFTYKNNQWSTPEILNTQTLTLSIFASALHYGQACFEGLKAFTQKDNKIRIFRPVENAKRLIESCRAVSMPYPSEQMFLSACKTVVSENSDFVPPYGFGGSMYLRPFVFGSGAVLGLHPADEYVFILVGNPVGDYYKGGLSPCKAIIQFGFDRAAPGGVVSSL